MGSVVWLGALGGLAVAAAIVLYAGLAWWARSLIASAVFVLVGAALTLVFPIYLTFPGPWPLNLDQAFLWWLTTAYGPLNSGNSLGAGLAVAGVIGLYRWATTRRLAVVDR
jgi:hypothetical protein